MLWWLRLSWEVEFSDELGEWWAGLTGPEQMSVDFSVRLFRRLVRRSACRIRHLNAHNGHRTGCAPVVATSRGAHMRELRIQHAGRPYRVLYAFDPRRIAISLVGGNKTGNDRCTRSMFRVQRRFTRRTYVS